MSRTVADHCNRDATRLLAKLDRRMDLHSFEIKQEKSKELAIGTEHHRYGIEVLLNHLGADFLPTSRLVPQDR